MRSRAETLTIDGTGPWLRASQQLAGILLDDGAIGGKTAMNVEKLVERIRAEFDEMPGMVLTVPQASKFFGVDQELMRSVTERLVASEHLRMTRDGEIASVRSLK